MTHRVLLALTTLFVAVAVQAVDVGPRVRASVTLPHETVLPGVPFDAIVTISNPADQPASVGLISRIMITLPDGTKLSPRMYHRLEPELADAPSSYVQLQPGESRQWCISWRYGAPDWAHLEGYSAPGSYGISFELVGAYSEQKPYDYVGPVTTSTAVLHRALPSDEDKVIWNDMARVADGHWTDDGLYNSSAGRSLLKEILTQHPGSAYYPYAVALELVAQRRPATDDDVTRAATAAARFKDSPAYPYLLTVAASYAESIAADAWWAKRQTADTLKYYRLAERYSADALASTSNPALLLEAKARVQRVRDDRARLETGLSNAHPPQ